jgi:hypothetical protein
MKRFLILTLAFLAINGLKAQSSNLIFFSEQGEHFSIVLNGVMQNVHPETNIKVTDLPAPNYKLKVIFEDKSLPDIDKTLVFGQGTETTFSIRKNKKNQYVVRYQGEIPIAQAPGEVPFQEVIIYHPVPVIESTTTTTTTVTPPTGTGVGVHIDDQSTGTNMDINVNVGGVGSQTTTTTTTTTTKGNSREVINEPYVPDNHENDGDHRDGHNHHDHHGIKDEPKYVLQGYNGEYGCPYPMSSNDFERAKQSIRSKSFEDSKLTIAKQIVNTNCLLSAQVKEIMLLFSFEDTRLELAKYCYGYTLDIGNYYKVNDAFTFESSIDELNKYIAGFRR